jgi:lysophospholipase L1-like esterase
MKGTSFPCGIPCGPFALAVFFLLACGTASAQVDLKYVKGDSARFFPADNKSLQYFGRVDFTDRKKPKLWAPGTYIKAKFLGSVCEISVHDEVPFDNAHNTLEIVVDDGTPYVHKLTGKKQTIQIAKGLSDGPHTLTICKNTEAAVGYIEFTGIKCKGLLTLPLKPSRKIEFIGNSITSGSGSDQSLTPCNQGQWFDQNNAYFSYGPIVSRTLNAQWQLTAASGIGLIHSCCNMPVTMPKVFANINQYKGTGTWDFKRYQPDAVTICLGENDGIQDSVKFCSAYVKFIEDVRSRYPKAQIVCLNSPMSDDALQRTLKNYITGVVDYAVQQGDKNVSKFFLSKRKGNGCGGHPDLAEHQLIADELSAYLATLLGWNN